MEMKKIFFAVLLISSAFLVSCQEVEDEKEFSYVKGSHNGPERWGEIHPEWSICNSGKMQSPIDLLNERVEVVSHLGRLKRSYRPFNATLVNRGHDMMLKWQGDAGYIKINGIQYQLKQCHWHSPSEHTINGKRFDLEMHLVHEAADGKTAVIGIVYKTGRPDPFLSMLEENFMALADTKGVERVVGVINPKNVPIGSRKYYRYIGSLTVPPCTQNVSWTMVHKVRTVSKHQVRLIREAVHDESETNARPVQAFNDRQLKLYRPNVEEEQN